MTPKSISAPPHRILLSPHRQIAYEPPRCRLRHERDRGMGVSQRIRVWFSCLRFAGRFASLSSPCRAGIVFGWRSSYQPPRLRQDLTTAQAACSCASRRHHARHYAQALIAIIVIIGTCARRRAGSAAWRRCGRSGFADANASLSPERERSGRHARRRGGFGSSERRRRGAPLSRRQSHRPRQPVVRALHEHGAAAFRLSRHRLGHGAFVRQLRPARLRPAGRRHRRDGRGAAAAMSASSPASMPRAIRS